MLVTLYIDVSDFDRLKLGETIIASPDILSDGFLDREEFKDNPELYFHPKKNFSLQISVSLFDVEKVVHCQETSRFYSREFFFIKLNNEIKN